MLQVKIIIYFVPYPYWSCYVSEVTCLAVLVQQDVSPTEQCRIIRQSHGGSNVTLLETQAGYRTVRGNNMARQKNKHCVNKEVAVRKTPKNQTTTPSLKHKSTPLPEPTPTISSTYRYRKTIGCEWRRLDRCVLFIALRILILLSQWYRRLRM